jgi:hypothetical protein
MEYDSFVSWLQKPKDENESKDKPDRRKIVSLVVINFEVCWVAISIVILIVVAIVVLVLVRHGWSDERNFPFVFLAKFDHQYHLKKVLGSICNSLSPR